MASAGSDADSGVDAGGLLGGQVKTPGVGGKRGRKQHRSLNEALDLLGRDSDAEDAGDEALGERPAAKRQKKAKKEKKERPPKTDAEKKKGAAAMKKQLLEKKDAVAPPQEAPDEEAAPPAPKKRGGRGRAAKRPDDDGEGDGGDEAGPRRRGGGGGRGGARAKAPKSESESEVEVTGDQLRRWSADLDARRDAGSANACTAFSIKEVPAVAIRRLSAASFLGQRKLEEGGWLLFDEEGKANAHFLLGTYAALKRMQQKSSDGLVGSVGEEDFRYLRWLVRKARTLRVVARSEVKRGKVLMKRIVAAKRRGVFSLALESNLVDGRGEDEGAEALGAEGAAPDAKFPERRPSGSAHDFGAQQERLRSHIVTRQKIVTATKSHDMDMQKARDMLQAPSLSFDWDIKDAEEEGGLEVDIPDSGKVDSRRDLFREQIQRSISANQAKGLARLERSASGLSRGASNQSLPAATEPSHSQAPPMQQAPPRPLAPAGPPHKTSANPSSSAAAGDAGAAPEPPSAPAPAASSAASAATASLDDARPGTATPTEAPAPEPIIAPGAAKPAAAAAPPPLDGEAAASTPLATPAAPSEGAVLATPGADAVAACPGGCVAPQDAMAPTQDFPDGISPTHFWSDAASGLRDSQAAADGIQPEPSLISPTAPFVPMGVPVPEISPTVPFVPMDAGPAEISATVPFVAHPVGEAGDAISPTMPFVAVGPPQAGGDKGPQLEISPTMPFVGAPAPISPTQPFVPHEAAQAAATGAQAVGGAGAAAAAGADVAPESERGRKRGGAEALGGGGNNAAGSDSDSADLDLEGLAGEDGEGLPEEQRRRREEDRAWKRQQRRRLLEEESLRRRREARHAREQRRAAGAAEALGAAAMSSEELSRFEDVIAGAWAPQKVQAGAGVGLQALAIGKSDDAELLGVRKAAQRRPKFLLGR